jgi:hypothetical protein
VLNVRRYRTCVNLWLLIRKDTIIRRHGDESKIVRVAFGKPERQCIVGICRRDHIGRARVTALRM